MARGRKIPTVTLTAQRRETLERWARRPTTAQALALRARIVLASAGGRRFRRRPGGADQLGDGEALAGAFLRHGSTGCSMSRGPARRARHR